MKSKLLILVIFLASTVGLASLASEKNQLERMILNSKVVMEAVQNYLDGQALTHEAASTMKLTSVSVISASHNQYRALFTYENTVEGTFLDPVIAVCSLEVSGEIVNGAPTFSAIREVDCGE